MFAFIKRVVESLHVSGSSGKIKNNQGVVNSGDKNIFAENVTILQHHKESKTNAKENNSAYEIVKLGARKRYWGSTDYYVFGGYNHPEIETEYQILLISKEKNGLEYYEAKSTSIPLCKRNRIESKQRWRLDKTSINYYIIEEDFLKPNYGIDFPEKVDNSEHKFRFQFHIDGDWSDVEWYFLLGIATRSLNPPSQRTNYINIEPSTINIQEVSEYVFHFGEIVSK